MDLPPVPNDGPKLEHLGKGRVRPPRKRSAKKPGPVGDPATRDGGGAAPDVVRNQTAHVTGASATGTDDEKPFRQKIGQSPLGQAGLSELTGFLKRKKDKEPDTDSSTVAEKRTSEGARTSPPIEKPERKTIAEVESQKQDDRSTAQPTIDPRPSPEKSTAPKQPNTDNKLSKAQVHAETPPVPPQRKSTPEPTPTNKPIEDKPGPRPPCPPPDTHAVEEVVPSTNTQANKPEAQVGRAGQNDSTKAPKKETQEPNKTKSTNEMRKKPTIVTDSKKDLPGAPGEIHDQKTEVAVRSRAGQSDVTRATQNDSQEANTGKGLTGGAKQIVEKPKLEVGRAGQNDSTKAPKKETQEPNKTKSTNEMRKKPTIVTDSKKDLPGAPGEIHDQKTEVAVRSRAGQSDVTRATQNDSQEANTGKGLTGGAKQIVEKPKLEGTNDGRKEATKPTQKDDPDDNKSKPNNEMKKESMVAKSGKDSTGVPRKPNENSKAAVRSSAGQNDATRAIQQKDNPGANKKTTPSADTGKGLAGGAKQIVEEPKLEGTDLLKTPWRKGSSNFSARDLASLKQYVESYKPPTYASVNCVRILLVGERDVGKSSFFHTINSIYKGYVALHATESTKYQEYEVRCGRGGRTMNFSLCDTIGLKEETRACDISDLQRLLCGTAQQTDQYSMEPRGCREGLDIMEQTHVVAVFLDASTVDYLTSSITQQLQSVINMAAKRDIPLLVILTKIDKLSPEIKADLSRINVSRSARDSVKQAASLVRIPEADVLPVKNYDTETELDQGVDTIAITALKRCLEKATAYLKQQHDKDASTVGDTAPLPSGWEELTDESGQVCYLHLASRTTQVRHPGLDTQRHEQTRYDVTPLPEGWEELTDESGQVCYLHLASGTTQGRHPGLDAQRHEQTRYDVAPLPEGWEELTDESGQVCYLHLASGTTQGRHPGLDAQRHEQTRYDVAPLPEGWEELTDESGQVCYLHLASGTTQGRHPGLDVQRHEQTRYDVAPLPEGWEELTDESGQVCYLHLESGTTQVRHPGLDAQRYEQTRYDVTPLPEGHEQTRCDVTTLPEGWEELTDESGQVCYLHLQSGTTQGRHPGLDTHRHEQTRYDVIPLAKGHEQTRYDVTPLPEGWEELTDESGQVCYLHLETGTTQVQHPGLDIQRNEQTRCDVTPLLESHEQKRYDVTTLPEGWEELTDESGQVCYLHLETGTTQVQHPGLHTQRNEQTRCDVTPLLERYEQKRYDVTPLPEGWEELTDESGQVCYLHLETGTTQVQHPGLDAQRHEETRYDVTPLPEGWEELTDESGQVCYLHLASGTTQGRHPGLDIQRHEQTRYDVAPLPEGWEELTDESGQVCYLHLQSGTTQGRHPGLDAQRQEQTRYDVTPLTGGVDPQGPAAVAAGALSARLPPGWEVLTDESGYQCYLDTTSGRIFQEPPPDAPLGWTVWHEADGTPVYMNDATGMSTTTYPTSSWR